MKNRKVILVIFAIVTIFILLLVLYQQNLVKQHQSQSDDKAVLPTDQQINSSSGCFVSNCHGLEIECGPVKAEFCTMEYVIGDVCRQFSQCGIVNNSCQPIYNEKFSVCRDCVKNCIEQHQENTENLFDCEAKCGNI
ncbi:MAG: hypothetical protein KatS3mg091_492 [Patescibacteria group bacterium]|nr:MAG: hypothetical protein KatS3mg091_492 [Patescibacteria group bacterium]